MLIYEFVPKYCKDILEKHSNLDQLSLDEFSYDEIVIDDFGKRTKIIYTSEGKQIPIRDILGLDEEDFVAEYPGADCLQAYKNYLSAYIAVEGEEYINELRNEICKSLEKVKMFSKLNIDNFY